jgi:hypothetical protein
MSGTTTPDSDTPPASDNTNDQDTPIVTDDGSDNDSSGTGNNPDAIHRG